MPRKKWYTLKKVKVRQSWHKYNLYNLTRLTIPTASEKTFFQQKWAAKSMTRAYHGAHIKEGHWERMFKRHMPSVAPMDHRYLAQHDGSEQAAGRGSGVDPIPGARERNKLPQKTPYMQMVYHPLERRLDTAIFRALFASSIRQARQFVVHGSVKVNGKKMIYPGYMLNPGDMFSVEPERVMYATGARKGQPRTPMEPVIQASRRGMEEEDIDNAELAQDLEYTEETDPNDLGADLESMSLDDSAGNQTKKALKSLLSEARTMLDDPKELSARQKQQLRAFGREVKKTLSSRPSDTSVTDSLQAQLLEIKNKLKGADSSASAKDSATAAKPEDEKLSARKQTEVDAALERIRENPRDDSKPYLTPWRPRDYMSAFTYIPRYLEVNQNVCSAVYLRHPVARPGLGEVPTPFNIETNQLAFNWYLKRR